MQQQIHYTWRLNKQQHQAILKTEQQSELPYEKIHNGNVKQQIEVFETFEQNLMRRQMLISEFKPPCDPNRSAVFQ